MKDEINLLEDQPYEGWKPLNWGQSWREIKKEFPEARAIPYTMAYDDWYYLSVSQYNTCRIYNFLGDCGALYFVGANTATKENLIDIKTLASNGGFNKVFCTVVTKMTAEQLLEYKNTFESVGFKCVAEQPSNRNEDKTSLTFLLTIETCNYKGY